MVYDLGLVAPMQQVYQFHGTSVLRPHMADRSTEVVFFGGSHAGFGLNVDFCGMLNCFLYRCRVMEFVLLYM